MESREIPVQRTAEITVDERTVLPYERDVVDVTIDDALPTEDASFPVEGQIFGLSNKKLSHVCYGDSLIGIYQGTPWMAVYNDPVGSNDRITITEIEGSISEFMEDKRLLWVRDMPGMPDFGKYCGISDRAFPDDD